ncbi:Excalibur calcium-binding domain-containing protein [Quadrisphaera sp. DSM 44207]|nr:Excalibur calcium-binding domain-containing protein [Quadrisphaera sp. DSM 44207]
MLRVVLPAVLAGLLAGCGAGLLAAPGPAPASAPAGAPGSALEALAAVPVKGRAPRTGYERERFGQAWADVDRNGCDTRNDVLARDLTGEVFEPGSDCVVVSGDLAEPYTPKAVRFQRGEGTSELVQVDHVVALSDAWQKGAQGWDDARRTAFANDPLNLLAVDGELNQAKGDADAATWLPPNRGYRCAYVARQVAVKSAHGLWMTQAEHDAVARVLAACPDEPLPAGDGAPAPPATPGGAAGAGAAGDGLDPRHGSCSQVVAAGLGPYRRGADPEYDWYQDGDGDGTACEG